MKLNVTSSIIDSPTQENHLLCTNLVVDDGSITLRVNCVSEEWDIRPLDRLDRERCPFYGIWTATFHRAGVDTPIVELGLGDTKLETPPDEPTLFGTEVYGVEALTEDLAVYNIINVLLLRLLQSPNYRNTPAVVFKERLDMAEWIMRCGIKHGKKDGDFKVHRIFDGMQVERTYAFGPKSGLWVKQTLVTYLFARNRRQTQLFSPNEHLYLSVEDFSKDPERYVHSLKQEPKLSRPAIPTLNMKTPQHICNQVVSIIQFFKSHGYNEELIYQFIDETNALTEKWLQQQMPDNRTGLMPGVGGLNHPMPMAQGVAPEIMQSFMGNIGNQPFGYNHMTPPPAVNHMEQAKTVHPEQPGFGGKDY